MPETTNLAPAVTPRFARLARACALADRCWAHPKGREDDLAFWNGPDRDQLDELQYLDELDFTYPCGSDGITFGPVEVQTARRVGDCLEITEKDRTVWEVHFAHRLETPFVPRLDQPDGPCWPKTVTLDYPPGPCRDRLTVVTHPQPDGPPIPHHLPLPNDRQSLLSLIQTLQSFLSEG